MARSLSHLIDEVPPTIPQSVPDSCGEESSDDDIQPKPLSGARIVPSSSRGPSSSKLGPRGSSGQLHGVRVEQVVGRGGKLVYQAVRDEGAAKYFTVQWRKPQTKKHKTWDGDAHLKVMGTKLSLHSEQGEMMGMSTLIGGEPVSGSEMRIGNYEIEVDNEVNEQEFKHATSILNKSARALPSAYAPSSYAKPFKTPTQIRAPLPNSGYIPPESKGYTKSSPAGSATEILDDTPIASSSKTSIRPISTESFYAKPPVDRINIGVKSKAQQIAWGGAIHDPKAENAVVMKRVPEERALSKGTTLVDVVLDPFLALKMRDHQIEGVKFMYNCVMGLGGAEGEGCILADEMGLGKTLQTIALIHMMLKQSPLAKYPSIIKKALVVCPVSLVANWKNEFRKWIPSNQINVIAADGSNDVQAMGFATNAGSHVLIIGYERLRKLISIATCGIGLIVCDEGHRLKSKDNKTTRMFRQINTTKRIILSGTPVQNDLGEYFSMVDFVCPAIVGTYQQFVKLYERPIVKSRTPGCPEAALEVGRERADELNALSREFVLRRTADVLDNYLPPKHEYVVFVSPSIHQLKAYGRIMNTDVFQRVQRGESSLMYIDAMRKIANSPTILRTKRSDEYSRSEEAVQMSKTALQDFPSDIHDYDVKASGKLSMLDRMLHAIFTKTDEKVVVVSNFTATLNVIQEVCRAKRYPYLRLDGSTAQKDRVTAVDHFNRGRRGDSFVFLLSAKAGGVGLNLIGASRLILFDSDWNPSTDLQAMARIHRDGQKKPVFIYRLLTTNSIDEKIYQRQITKTGLADQMLDHNSTAEKTKDSFSHSELKDIFRLDLYTEGCQTHDLLSCDCLDAKVAEPLFDTNDIASEDEGGSEDERPKFKPATQFNPAPTRKMLKKAAKEQQEKLAALKNWTHMDGFKKSSFSDVADTLLYEIMWDHYDMEEESANVSSVVSKDGTPDMAPDSEEDSDNDAAPKKKSKIVSKDDGLDDLRFLTDDEFDNVLAAAKDENKGDDKSDDLDDDKVMDSEADEEVVVPKKRKSTSSRSGSSSSKGSKGKKKDKGKGRGMARSRDSAKQHNLQTIAEAGKVGRVMFLFEKVSKGEL